MEVKRNMWFKTLAAFLAFVMVIQILPLSVFADEIKNAPEEFVSEEQNFDIVDEVIDERTEYKKVYELSDGTFYEINSATPIHENLNREWVEPEIDVEEPETTKEAVERCNELSEIINNSNSSHGIATTNFEISAPNETKINYTILSKTSRDNSVLKSGNTLVTKLPVKEKRTTNETQITVFCQMQLYCEVSKAGKIYAQNITNSWDIDNDNLTSSAISISEHIIDYTSVKNSGIYSWDITDSYLKWEKGLKDNNGIALTIKDKCSVTPDTYVYMARQYRVIDSYDTDFSYHKIDMGRAGNVYINDFTNTVLLSRNELSIENSLSTVKLVRYFDFGYSYDVFNPSGESSRWNYDSSIKFVTSNEYSWKMPDGNVRYFTPYTPNTNLNLSSDYSYWIDKNEEYILSLKKDIGVNDFTDSTIMIKDEIENNIEKRNLYSFDEKGKLISIKDEYDNEIIISYYALDDIEKSSRKDTIQYVTDSNNHLYEFKYSSENFEHKKTNDTTEIVSRTCLSGITVKSLIDNEYEIIDIGGETVNLQYEYKMLTDYHIVLSKVIYPDNEFVTYNYNEDGYLTDIIDVDGRKLSFDYTAQIPEYTYNKNGEIKPSYNSVDLYPSVAEYKELVKNIDDDIIITDINDPCYNEYLEKSSLTIDRHNNYQRVFTNHLGEKQIIQYSPRLKKIYQKEFSGEVYYADYTDTREQKDVLSQIVSPEESNNLVINPGFEGDVLNDSIGEIESWYEWDGNSLDLIEDDTERENSEFLLEISGTNTDIRAAVQDIRVDAKSGDYFVVGGYGRANAAIPNQSHFFGLEVYACTVNNPALTEPDVIPNDEPLYCLPFDSSIDYELQYRLGAFEIPENTLYLQVRLVYSYQSGMAHFDDIQLYKSSKENVTFFNETEEEIEPAALSEETKDLEDTKTLTNDKGLVTAEIMSDGNVSMVSQYTYDDNYYLSSFTDTNNVENKYDYDPDNGTLKSLTIGNKKTVYSYTPTGALKEVSRVILGSEDSGEKISASYNYSHDRITSITHNGIKYNLTYNSFGNVKKVDLEPLADAANKNDLISYDYSKDYKQNLNSIAYANGDVLSYSYDDNNNVTEIYFKSNSDSESRLLYKYEYNDNNLSKITDYDSNRITEYTSNGYRVFGFNPTASEEEPFLLYSINSVYNEKDGATVNSETLFGSTYTYTKYEDSYNEENNETTYTSKSQFDYKVCSYNMNNNCVSDYFGRIKSSEMAVSYELKNDNETSEDDNSAIESETLNKTRSIKSTYTYKDGDDFNGSATTTNLIDTYTTKISLLDENNSESDEIPSFCSSYEYDNAGRITHIYYGESLSDLDLVSYYEYDKYGQIKTDAALHIGRITEYSYDLGGNITSKRIYDCNSLEEDSIQNILNNLGEPSETIEYKYSNNENAALNGFSDLLTSYDGTPIEYDAIGNPLNYYNGNGNNDPYDFNLEWQGTLLKSMTAKDGKSKYEYTYNQNGLRTKKTVYSDSNLEVPAGTVSYIWQNDQLCGYQIITYDDNGAEQGNVNIKMLYDEYDMPIGIYLMSNLENAEQTSDLFENDENIFWFVKDGQGNVIAMYSDTDQKKALGCHYDGAGNLVIDTSGTFMDDIQAQIDKAMKENPKWGWIAAFFLALAAGLAMAVILLIDQTAYRGYTYDFETGLYYCQNRYYSPAWGRFISMDDPAQLTLNIDEPLNANLYAYCYNDPVNNIDPNGRSSYSFTGVGLQAEMSACLLSFAGEVGIELIYTWSKNALYAYYYYGGGAGAGYTNKAINYLSSSFKDIAMSPKVSLKNIANLFKLNYSISIGFFAAFTNKSFSWPNSYVGLTNSNSVSIGKWKGYRSTSSGCKTYGICYSPVGNSGFAFSKTTARYKKISFNSSKVKSYLSSQKNNIKKAVS